MAVSDKPMMACGHQANGVCSGMKGQVYDPPVPACVICRCIEQDANPPDLSERIARCDYYGQTWSGRLHESNHGCKRGEPCMCKAPSTESQAGRLAFFTYQPQKEFDMFYCGCHGWD